MIVQIALERLELLEADAIGGARVVGGMKLPVRCRISAIASPTKRCSDSIMRIGFSTGPNGADGDGAPLRAAASRATMKGKSTRSSLVM